MKLVSVARRYLESITAVSLALNLLLKLLQSVEVNTPRLVADAFGKLKLCTVPEETMFILVPVVPIAKLCPPPNESGSPFSPMELFTSLLFSMVASLIFSLVTASVESLLLLMASGATWGLG